MGNKLYVGNLPYSVRDSDLEQAFGQFGSVTSAKVTDRAIRDHPYESIGIAFGVGVLLGVLINRK